MPEMEFDEGRLSAIIGRCCEIEIRIIILPAGIINHTTQGICCRRCAASYAKIDYSSASSIFFFRRADLAFYNSEEFGLPQVPQFNASLKAGHKSGDFILVPKI